jgi:hypothetical protein
MLLPKKSSKFKRDTLVEELERKLDSFNAVDRGQALGALIEQVETGQITLPEAGASVNLHCHTFCSYNSYGYSPSKFAWLARKVGLAVAGVVDFDVLDALEEFLAAARRLGLKACAGLETRVFVPEFSTRVINSPGEPGISYHMGVGFPKANLEGEQDEFLLNLRKTAQRRNRELLGGVNKYLQPIELDYERDVLVLTASGNATERHVCLAFARKAKEFFEDDDALSQFWAKKLGPEAASLEMPQGIDLLNMIRAKTMKRGGVGYVMQEKGSFPLMADFNRFVLAAGGIPTMTWLDGLSDGEQALEELVEVAMSTGTAAINVIPDRNYTAGVKDKKLENLYHMVALAEELGLPVVVGTEMNSPGQKFVDDFDSKELSPVLGVFLKGAYIVYAHSVLQQQAGLGYTSEWSKGNFGSVADRNEFFERLGRSLAVEHEGTLADLTEDATAEEILDKVSN